MLDAALPAFGRGYSRDTQTTALGGPPELNDGTLLKTPYTLAAGLTEIKLELNWECPCWLDLTGPEAAVC